MKVLVTGCAGFIGSTVARILLESGERVVGIDNINDAYDVRIKHKRLEGLTSNPNLTFHEAELSDLEAMRAIFVSSKIGDEPPFSAVINLGARAGVRDSVINPWIYYESNTLGNLNLLEMCREFGVPKFVLSSTSSVYGDDSPQPFHEGLDTSQPVSPYAASKKAAEVMCYTYHFLHNIDVTVLRYFTVYGPAGRPDMAMLRFIRAISEDETITVFGDGTAERDFTYVDDIARGTIAATRRVGFETVNLGNDGPKSVNTLIRTIEDCLEKKAQIQYVPMNSADMQKTWADIRKADEVLDWRPQVSLEEGVRRTIDWYMANRDWASQIRG